METTKKEFEEFKKWCLYYMDKFQMNDWDVYFVLKNLEDAIAKSNIKVYSRVVTFYLDENLNDIDKQMSMKSNARHEVCHLLISEVDILIGSYCTEDEQKIAKEKLVVKLTNLLKDK